LLAHLQFAPVIAQTKNCKRANKANARTERQCSKLIGKMTENKEHQPLTSGIKHWGLSGYVSVLPRIKFSVTGQVSSPQSPTFHTAIR